MICGRDDQAKVWLLVSHGVVPVMTESEVARIDADRPGTGFPLLAPTVDLVEIGTGGGLIAALNQFRVLKVGPPSAGARPGPACYGLGGTEPTTTDADLLLGYLDPDYFVGGEFPLHRTYAEAAIDRLARTFEFDHVRMAWAIHDVANETMANAAKTRPRSAASISAGTASSPQAAQGLSMPGESPKSSAFDGWCFLRWRV